MSTCMDHTDDSLRMSGEPFAVSGGVSRPGSIGQADWRVEGFAHLSRSDLSSLVDIGSRWKREPDERALTASNHGVEISPPDNKVKRVRSLDGQH